MPYACPLCGATTNRKGDPFDSAQNVVFHIDSKRDEVHEGESGAVLRDDIELVAEAASSEPDADAATVTDGGPASTQQPAQQPAQQAESGRDTVDMTPGELDEAIEAARDVGYQDGLAEGRQETEEMDLTDEEMGQVYADAYEEGYNDALEEAGGGGQLESVPLPCGHEELDPEEILPDQEIPVGCELCGEWYDWTPSFKRG